MTDQRSITPSPELLQLWFEQHHDYNKGINELLIEAVQYGADQELEACCEYLVRCAQWEPEDVDELRAARRPKPPSLKEQALAKVAELESDEPRYRTGLAEIRRALEALPE